MMSPVLFFDIDGVLNTHRPTASGYCAIEGEFVIRLNQIIAEAAPYLVVTSAWRYLISPESMTFKGFESLLLSHGLAINPGRLSHTALNDTPDEDRGLLIGQWIEKNAPEIPRYAILDDLDLGIRHKHGRRFVRTQGAKGLTCVEVAKVLDLLVG